MNFFKSKWKVNSLKAFQKLRKVNLLEISSNGSDKFLFKKNQKVMKLNIIEIIKTQLLKIRLQYL